jgi:hypothetical protein
VAYMEVQVEQTESGVYAGACVEDRVWNECWCGAANKL